MKVIIFITMIKRNRLLCSAFLKTRQTFWGGAAVTRPITTFNYCEHQPEQSQLLIRFSQHSILLKRVISTNGTASYCWKCQKKLCKSIFYCESCSTIQKAKQDVNYYDLFALRQEYDINITSVTTKYRDIQRILHPDRHTLKSKEEQLAAEEYSSLINKAFSVLRNPWLRGIYLLKLANIDFDELTSVDDSQLLLKVMERSECIAEVQTLNGLRAIEKDNLKDMNIAAEAVSQAFKGEDLAEAKKSLIKLRYFHNMNEKISEKLHELVGQ